MTDRERQEKIQRDIARFSRPTFEDSAWLLAQLDETHARIQELEHIFGVDTGMGREDWCPAWDLAQAEAEKERLRDALKQAEEVMNYMGDILNGLDVVTPADEEYTTPRFQVVRAALAPQGASHE